MGDAAKDGIRDIVELLVRAGADPELDRGTYGTPLLAACEFGRFSTVKYLVRVGANVISSKGGQPFSAVKAAQSFPNIVRWLLVDRYTEQAKIEYSARLEERSICPWSGIQRVKVEIPGLHSQLYPGSSIDYAEELAKRREQLRGQVVHVFRETEDQSADDL